MEQNNLLEPEENPDREETGSEPEPRCFTVCVIPPEYTSLFLVKDLPFIQSNLEIDPENELFYFFDDNEIPWTWKSEGCANAEIRRFSTLDEARHTLLDNGVDRKCVIVNISDRWNFAQHRISLNKLIYEFCRGAVFNWCYNGMLIVTPKIFCRLTRFTSLFYSLLDNVCIFDGDSYSIFKQNCLKIPKSEEKKYVFDYDEPRCRYCDYCGEMLISDSDIRYFQTPDGQTRIYCPMCYDFEHRFDSDGASDPDNKSSHF